MTRSGEGAKVDLRAQVPLTRVIETLRYRGRGDRATDFGRVFGRGMGCSGKCQRQGNRRQGGGHQKGRGRGRWLE